MTADKNQKKITRELQALRGITYQAALNELRKLPVDVSWRAYVDRVKRQQQDGTSLEPPLVTPSEEPLTREDELRRGRPDGVMEAVAKGGGIRVSTLVELMDLLSDRTDYKFHVELAIRTGALLKTVDNEADALETIRRLKAATPKEKAC